MLYLNSLAILEVTIINLETPDGAEIARCRHTQNGRGLSDGSCVVVPSYVEVFNHHIHCSAYGIQVIQDIIDESLILDSDIARLREKVEDFFVFKHCHILVVVIAHCDGTFVLDLHGYQLSVDDGVLIYVILHGEHLSAIEVTHVVNEEHEGAAIEVHEAISIEEYFLRTEDGITHSLRMHINERSRLHIQISTPIEGAVSDYEVIK